MLAPTQLVYRLAECKVGQSVLIDPQWILDEAISFCSPVAFTVNSAC